MQIERVLDPQQIFLDRRRDGVEQRTVATAEAAACMLEFRVAGQLGLQIEGIAQIAQRGMLAVRVHSVVEQLPGRLLRRVGRQGRQGRILGLLAQLPFHTGKHLTQGLLAAGVERTVGEGLGDPRGHPHHTPDRFLVEQRRQRLQRGDQRTGVARRPARRPGLKRGTQRTQGRVATAAGLRLRRRRHRHGPGEIGREQDALAESGLAARRTQLVEQRQQHDRNVAMPALETLEIIGQQQHAAQQRGRGGVPVGGGVVAQRVGQPLHFLDDHRRRVQLHHAQGALGLVQITGAQTHPARVVGGFDEALELDPCLAQHLVEFGLDPAEHRVVDGVAEPVHRVAPRRTSRVDGPEKHAVMRGSVSALRPAA